MCLFFFFFKYTFTHQDAILMHAHYIYYIFLAPFLNFYLDRCFLLVFVSFLLCFTK